MVRSEWVCRSQMPGMTMHPVASMTCPALQSSISPGLGSVGGPPVRLMAATTPSFTATSPQNHGLPVPSTILPPFMR